MPIYTALGRQDVEFVGSRDYMRPIFPNASKNRMTLQRLQMKDEEFNFHSKLGVVTKKNSTKAGW